MITTFYSFKGGAGRSLALANIAVLLAQWERRVLAVDFDLEAPGLSEYMRTEFRLSLDQHEGLLDLLRAAARDGEKPDWRQYTQQVASYGKGTLSLITSGRADASYPGHLLDFDWPRFFGEQGGGAFIESLRDAWLEEYDFVLVDSRTGITDIGGICTIQLPDIIVAVFTASEQSVGGVIDILRRAQAGRQALAYDRPQLAVVPLPSRFETRTEYELSQKWLDDFASRFSEFYETWLPRGLSARDMLERTKLPYVAYYSFGERLPVLHESGNDPESLAYALRATARLLDQRLAGAREILTGAPERGEQEPGLLSKIAATDRKLDQTPDAALAWPALTRMVRIVPQAAGPARLEPTSFHLAGPGGIRVAEILDRLPVVRVANRVAAWADDRIVAEWPRLRDMVDSDSEFLLWAQRFHEQDQGATFSGAELTEAMAWYLRRGKDLTEEERHRIRLREHEYRELRTFPGLGRWLRALRATPGAIAFGLLGTLGTVFVSAGLLHQTSTSLPQALLIAGLVVVLGAVLDGFWLGRAWHALRPATLTVSGAVAGVMPREASHVLERMGYRTRYSSDTAVYLEISRDASPPLPAAARRVAYGDSAYDVILLARDTEDTRQALVASGPRGVLADLARAVESGAGRVELGPPRSLLRQ